MSRNRFRPSRRVHVRKTFATLTDVTLDTLVYLRPVLRALFVMLVCAGIGWGVFDAAKRSPYFKITAVRVEDAHRVGRDEILAALRIDKEANYFRFDALKARQRLLEHDWIADVSVETHLPNHLTVRIQERKPVAVVALESLYLVDAEGKVFASAVDLVELPSLVITGLSKEEFQSEPENFKATVRTALALERLFQQSEAAKYGHLDSVHVGVAGRWELMLGSTHVILGIDRTEERLAYLADVLRTLDERQVGAEYIMLAPELNRAIVKERSLDGKTTELSLGTNTTRGETR